MAARRLARCRLRHDCLRLLQRIRQLLALRGLVSLLRQTAHHMIVLLALLLLQLLFCLALHPREGSGEAAMPQ